MPKTILLIRHAKAQPFGLVRRDFDRTLDPRGVQDAKTAGADLKKRGIHPSLFLASPAPRALYTLRLILSEMGLDPEQVLTDAVLYDASSDDLLERIRAFPDDVGCAMLCGHNPAVSELTGALLDGPCAPMAPCDIAALTVQSSRWADFGLLPASCDFRIASGRRA